MKSASFIPMEPISALVLKILVILTAIGSVVSMGPAPCPAVQLNACTAPLIEAVEKSSSAFGYFSDAELNHICRSCDNLPLCLKQASLGGCSDHQLSDLEGIQHSCSYFCQEELREYRTHRSCFNNTALQREGASCNQSLALASALALGEQDQLLGHGNEKKYSRQDRNNLKCQYISEYIECMRDAVTSHCSSEAGEWVFRTYQHYFSPIMEQDCLPTGSKVGVAIIFGTAIGLFTIMLIVIFTSIMCQRKQAPTSRIVSDQLNTFSNVTKENRSSKWNEISNKSTTQNTRRKSETTYVSMSPQKTYSTPKHSWNQCAIENSPHETMGLLTSHQKDDENKKNDGKKGREEQMELINLTSKPELD